MAPSVAENIITVSLEHASPAELDTRPSKRPRKGGSTRDVPEEASPSAPAQLDHIFIADGIVAKKGGKKVCVILDLNPDASLNRVTTDASIMC